MPRERLHVSAPDADAFLERARQEEGRAARLRRDAARLAARAAHLEGLVREREAAVQAECLLSASGKAAGGAEVRLFAARNRNCRLTCAVERLAAEDRSARAERAALGRATASATVARLRAELRAERRAGAALRQEAATRPCGGAGWWHQMARAEAAAAREEKKVEGLRRERDSAAKRARAAEALLASERRRVASLVRRSQSVEGALSREHREKESAMAAQLESTAPALTRARERADHMADRVALARAELNAVRSRAERRHAAAEDALGRAQLASRAGLEAVSRARAAVAATGSRGPLLEETSGGSGSGGGGSLETLWDEHLGPLVERLARAATDAERAEVEASERLDEAARALERHNAEDVSSLHRSIHQKQMERVRLEDMLHMAKGGSEHHSAGSRWSSSM